MQFIQFTEERQQKAHKMLMIYCFKWCEI